MQANDIKKGMHIRTHNGIGEMMDSRKGIIRTMKQPNPLFGGHSLGDDYIWNIREVLNPATGQWEAVEFSPVQQKRRQAVRAAGF